MAMWTIPTATMSPVGTTSMASGTDGTIAHRMAGTLATLRTGPPADSPIEQLQADLYDSIQQLQFYDRMVQHLSHVQDFLSSAAHQLASAATYEEQSRRIHGA